MLNKILLLSLTLHCERISQPLVIADLFILGQIELRSKKHKRTSLWVLM